MCLAVPMLLESLTDKDAGMAALGGSRHEVDLSLIDNPQPGDYLIVHAGFAIEKLDTEEAEARLRLFDELAATP
jgi:hydrogenase expression/formation protein HypC